VAVALVDCRVAGEEVEVAAAINIPHVNPLHTAGWQGELDGGEPQRQRALEAQQGGAMLQGAAVASAGTDGERWWRQESMRRWGRDGLSVPRRG
jgi:hypothetical protein